MTDGKNDTAKQTRTWLTTAQLRQIQNQPDLAIEQSMYSLDSETSIYHNSQSSKLLSLASTMFQHL